MRRPLRADSPHQFPESSITLLDRAHMWDTPPHMGYATTAKSYDFLGLDCGRHIGQDHRPKYAKLRS